MIRVCILSLLFKVSYLVLFNYSIFNRFLTTDRLKIQYDAVVLEFCECFLPLSTQKFNMEVRVNNKLYVSNLPYSVTDQSLGQMFASYGTVLSSKIITDKMSGRSKGFGFVEMEDESQATEAMEKLNGQEINGRRLNVAIARPQEPRENSMRRDR